ncbi:uncharacterized protein LOC113874705 [Abrus precatorius]|uniref:Uncharacterized protein LOC113874705 n=1 Tax=Abrus precatorius TaxID=3816 RepID=A0A8B8MJ13_ABRPR|nr:uncharacterized protein LOC113874705 [Abrus precatorius]
MKRQQSSASNCVLCGASQTLSVIIHNVRYRSKTHSYCTNCVLRQHPGTFCPICFELFDDSLRPNLRLMCVRCPSIAHRSCALPSTDDSAAAAPAFLCPTCVDPNITFFKPPDRETGACDVESGKVLVAAAQIAALSMSRAAAAARFEAERRAREAVVAKRRAKEAVENFEAIVAMEEGAMTEQRGSSGRNARRHAPS